MTILQYYNFKMLKLVSKIIYLQEPPARYPKLSMVNFSDTESQIKMSYLPCVTN